jgi:PadR family transcriptional regulator PadR
MTITKGMYADDRDLYSGLIRLHVLHHAAEEPIFGLGMAEELSRHGYRISPGTLYPILYGLEKKGYLRAAPERNGRTFRNVYRITPLGRRALKAAKHKVRELFGELIEGKEPAAMHERRALHAGHNSARRKR